MTVEVVTDSKSPQTAYLQFEVPRDPNEGMSPITRWLTASFGFADQTASVIPVHVPPMTFVKSVVLQIATAWTDTTAVKVGDGTNDDGWIVSGQIDPTVAGEMELDYDAAYTVTGKLYADGDTIDATFAGVATAGTGKLFIEVISYNEALADS